MAAGRVAAEQVLEQPAGGALPALAEPEAGQHGAPVGPPDAGHRTRLPADRHETRRRAGNDAYRRHRTASQAKYLQIPERRQRHLQVLVISIRQTSQASYSHSQTARQGWGFRTQQLMSSVCCPA